MTTTEPNETSVGQILSGTYAKSIIETWKPLARHAEACEVCEPVVAELRGVPDNPYPHRDRLCAAGRDLYDPWADAKLALITRLKWVNRRRNMAGLVGEAAELRALALTSMPAPAFKALMQVEDDELREAQIQAIEAGYRRGQPAPAADLIECALEGCDVRFRPPKHAPNKRYCSDAHRQTADRRARPRAALSGTEE